MQKYNLTILAITLTLLCSVTQSLDSPQAFDATKLRNLRRSENEILDLQYFKNKIRRDYYNTTPGIEETRLRQGLVQMIDFKNKVPRHNLVNFDTLSNNFEPENSQYIQGIIYSTCIVAWGTILFFLIFLLVIICRFVFKRCDAKLERDDEYSPEHKTRFYVGQIFIIALFVSGSALCMFGNFGFLSQSMNSISQLRDQASNMTQDIQFVIDNVRAINQEPTPEQYSGLYGSRPQISTSELTKVVVVEGQQISQSSSDFADLLNRFETGIFISLFICFIAGIICVVLTCISLSKNSPGFALGGGLFSLFWLGTCMILTSTMTFYYMYLFDYCEAVINITDNNQIPFQGKGLGNYLSCLPTESNTLVTTIGFDINTEYLKGISLVNFRLQELNVSTQVNNFDQLKTIMNANDVIKVDSDLKVWYKILDYEEQSMHTIENLVQCKHLITFALQQNDGFCNDGFFYHNFVYLGICLINMCFVFYTVHNFFLNNFLRQKQMYENAIMTSFGVPANGSKESPQQSLNNKKKKKSMVDMTQDEDKRDHNETDNLIKKGNHTSNESKKQKFKSSRSNNVSSSQDFTGVDKQDLGNTTFSKKKKQHQSQQDRTIFDDDENPDTNNIMKSTSTLHVTAEKTHENPFDFTDPDMSTIVKKKKGGKKSKNE